MSAILVATLVGTYLDLYFVGKGYYSFPHRPMPAVFSIHVFYTLIGVPIISGGFLYLCSKMKILQRVLLIFLLSLF
ncbi:hypothetical protein J9303_15095, partial [Bacillaceae bacterium Marseille-Q3522]|nr:hypothetical protein [Bacillaceae bacterium Marseille-Q3522]